MAYTLGNNCSKNLCKRTVLLQFIIKSVVTCFFGTQCSFSIPNVMAIFQRNSPHPLTGPLNACGVSINRDSEPISGSIACCERQAQHTAATDHGELITLVAGKRRSLLMAENDDEVYDKKPQRYAEDNIAAFNCTQW